MRVLVTGGAGFIGSHLIDLLLSRPDIEAVLVFDNLVRQVHPSSPDWPAYLTEARPEDWRETWTDRGPGAPPAIVQARAGRWFGDVRDPNAVARALESFRPTVVVHLAALVGVGQSGELPAQYVSTNVTGTSVIVEMVKRYNEQAEFRRTALAELNRPIDERLVALGEGPNAPGRDDLEAADLELRAQIEHLPERPIGVTVIAGSMSSYGEGGAVAVPEYRPLAPASVYAWTKAAQEQIATQIATQHGLDVRIARFFNVIGARQALTNPYTGIAAIFAARNLVGLPARIYEDGQQERDFVDVRDVATALVAIIEHGAPGGTYNVCTSTPRTVLDVAETIRAEFERAGDRPPLPDVTGLVRAGDVRDCFGDSTRLRSLGWQPAHSFASSIADLVAWVRLQPESVRAAVLDRAEQAHQELLDGGLLTAAGPGGEQ